MFPEIFKAITGTNFESFPAILLDHKRYGVISKNGREQYPGMAKEEGASVEGIVLFNLDEKTLKLIDTLEGDDYNRSEVKVNVNGEMVDATAYVWQGHPEKKLSGEWDPEDFKKNHLNFYLTEKIPRYLKN